MTVWHYLSHQQLPGEFWKDLCCFTPPSSSLETLHTTPVHSLCISAPFYQCRQRMSTATWPRFQPLVTDQYNLSTTDSAVLFFSSTTASPRRWATPVYSRSIMCTWASLERREPPWRGSSAELVRSTTSETSVMGDFTTSVTAMVKAPFSLARRMQSTVSFVLPEWEKPTHTSSSSTWAMAIISSWAWAYPCRSPPGGTFSTLPRTSPFCRRSGGSESRWGWSSPPSF